MARGKFPVFPRFERRALLADVERAAKLGDRTILDSRTLEEFEGKKLQGQNRGGRIPRSRLVPELSLYKKNGKYVEADELKRLVGNTSRPITYCVGGVRSALLALLMEARLGIQAANYDGSIWEWAVDKELPLLTGSPASSAGKR